MMMTTPEELDKAFHISLLERPRGLMSKFIEKLPPGLTDNHDVSFYQKAYEHSGYGMNIRTVISNLWKRKEHVDFYTELSKSRGKKVLSAEEYETALICKKELVHNPCTKHYFTGRAKVLYQLPIYFKLVFQQNEQPWHFAKGMLDMLVINHAERTIEIIDIKTTRKGADEFPYAFRTYGYYIQAYFYWYAVKELLAGNAVSPAFPSKLLEEVKSYTVKAPLFMVVPKVEGKRALLYSLTNEDMQVIYEGTASMEGVKSLIDRWVFHNETREWEFPREVYQNDGKIPLKIA